MFSLLQPCFPWAPPYIRFLQVYSGATFANGHGFGRLFGAVHEPENRLKKDGSIGEILERNGSF